MIKDKLQTIQQAYTFLWDFYKFTAKFQFMDKPSADIYLKANKQEEKLLEETFSLCNKLIDQQTELLGIMKEIDKTHKPLIEESKSPSIIS